MRGQINELNQQAEEISKSNLEQQQNHEDTLTKRIQTSSFVLIDRFTKGTAQIISQAQRDAEKLRDTIRVLKERQLPNITYGALPPDCIQTNDTLFMLLPFLNSGGGIAKNITMQIFFIYSDGTKDYEYYEPIGSGWSGVEIPAGDTKHLIKGHGSYITKYKMDSTNSYQFILVLGSYTGDDNKNPIKRYFRLCYHWVPNEKIWGEYTNIDEIENAHKNPNITYFGKSNR